MIGEKASDMIKASWPQNKNDKNGDASGDDSPKADCDSTSTKAASSVNQEEEIIQGGTEKR